MRNSLVEVGGIVGTLFEPDEEPVAVLVMHPATATPAGFYAGFAEFLAENRIAAVTYDYRGTGRSGSPKAHRDLGMKDWIEQDVPAVTRWAAGRFPGLPQLAVGHSLGGHALTLGHGGPELTAFALVASHVASIASIPDRVERLRVRLVLQGLGPVLAGVFGYVPARRLGLGEDIPVAAIRQWGGWGARRNYLFDDPAMDGAGRAAAVTQPVLAIGMSDDPWGTPAQVDRLAGYLTGADVERRTYTPAGAGVARIGHHGFMRRTMRGTLWTDLLTWFHKQL
ncbi:alpha/beta hydrolase family protein [Actinoplanes derwentensis]|uniref:Predicted alpha/beta hydrolase n=1 Tax=Actinoplanes derwentensis TaxID=113562 RepID=A0A1H2AR57_9ACTN|nr:alpha/beta hydrolase [Actinoplanes derwentensis]GID84372.1 alpha/beta hydrolase [Actinoplanes derwentensis]SDT48450.1 Predicted alpha/beta hydrolase [Actinoplanes derwentensis]